MVSRTALAWSVLIMLLLTNASASAQQAGSIRGIVYDEDFDVPLALAQVTIVERRERVTTSEQGDYVFPRIPPGQYTLVFSKDGYAREVRTDVVVSADRLTEVDASLSGEFVEMDEFVVQEIIIGGGTEVGLLQLRADSPAFIDSISTELLSRSGFSDAASALNLVSGATVQDGKSAVIRGLPDRYVNSQMNGVRLPTADEDKRAVQLDQFPATVIESIQISKTFTPDQQGDASGGAVNVILKGVPEENILQFKSQISYNTQVTGRRDFLTYKGGGVDFWGADADDRGIQLDNLGEDWDGAVGVSTGEAPTDYKWSIGAGGRHVLDNGVAVGGYASFFYERDSSFFDDGIDDSYWVVNPGEVPTPQTSQGSPGDGDFKTALFDVTQATEFVQWGGLGTFGIESENHELGLTYLYTHIAEDTATLAEDTRGKAYFTQDLYGVPYDSDDSMNPGNINRDAAPYLRTETLEYTERTTETLQLHGRHTLPFDDLKVGELLAFHTPELDWTVARSSATLDQPDKRQFGSLWLGPKFNPGFPPFVPPFEQPAVHRPFKPAANFTLGNLQRIWKDIREDSEQYQLNLTLPFTQWTGDEGYLKIGLFDDVVDREFNQDTFSNFNDNDAQLFGDFDDFWSAEFPFEEGHPITDGPPFVDVDYEGRQEISAWYVTADVPLTPWLNLIGGVRFESTQLSIVNVAEEDATWFPPDAPAPVSLGPGDADVTFDQDDRLPAIGLVLVPVENVTLRASYSETVARQTFKELTPIQQQEFLGGDIFIGNPELQMSSLKNYDLRLDYTPYPGGLISVSYFHKDITNPIEVIQRVVGFTFETPVNFPKGELSGWELEVRQEMGAFWEPLQGLSLGANATFIDSEVTLPPDQIEIFSSPAIQAPMTTRNMTNAPEHLYNLFLTYDLEATGTQVGLFYTIKGDTLIAGAGESDGNFVPSVYALEYGTLNLTVSQQLGRYLKLQFQAKNLTNPTIEEVYRSEFIGEDVTKTSFTRGIDYSLGLSAEIPF